MQRSTRDNFLARQKIDPLGTSQWITLQVSTHFINCNTTFKCICTSKNYTRQKIRKSKMEWRWKYFEIASSNVNLLSFRHSVRFLQLLFGSSTPQSVCIYTQTYAKLRQHIFRAEVCHIILPCVIWHLPWVINHILDIFYIVKLLRKTRCSIMNKTEAKIVDPSQRVGHRFQKVMCLCLYWSVRVQWPREWY